ncbi:hypothetical protein KA005_72965, partial [bacterium]|nr:hypothetical protein [bacterium]
GKPVGLKETKRLLEELPNKINNKLGIIPSVEIEKINKLNVIKIIVKPSSVPISYDGKFYIRSGSTVQELQGKDLSNFLLKISGNTWDEIIEERASYNEIDEEAVENFKRYAVDRIPSIAKELFEQTGKGRSVHYIFKKPGN